MRNRVGTLLALQCLELIAGRFLNRRRLKRIHARWRLRRRHGMRSVRPGHIPRDCHRRWPGWVPF